MESNPIAVYGILYTPILLGSFFAIDATTGATTIRTWTPSYAARPLTRRMPFTPASAETPRRASAVGEGPRLQRLPMAPRLPQPRVTGSRVGDRGWSFKNNAEYLERPYLRQRHRPAAVTLGERAVTAHRSRPSGRERARLWSLSPPSPSPGQPG